MNDTTTWLLHGLRAPDQATIEHAELACDDRFPRFLTARLREEEARAVLRRPHHGRGDSGLGLLRDLLADLAEGRLPDDVTLDLVLTAYAAHPDFRPEWRAPAALTTPVGSAS